MVAGNTKGGSITVTLNTWFCVRERQERQVKMEWGKSKRGRKRQLEKRIKVLEVDGRREMRTVWVEKVTVGKTPENV